MGGPARDQGKGGAHRPEVGTEVDDVRNEQQADQRVNGRRRVVTLEIAGKAAAGHPSDTRADLLHRAHQRPARE
jgi:hypothetical protein